MSILTSFVIPTYKRNNSLLRLLKSLKKEIDKHSEIIIVEQVFNNGKQFKHFALKNRINMKYFFLNDLNVSRARNIGIKKSKGDYIIFLDDDVIVKSGLIINYLKNFKDSNVGAVTGRVITSGSSEYFVGQNVGKITFWGNFTDNFSSKIKQEVDTAITCNACWRRKILNKIKGFDENFKFAFREDSDLSLRTKMEGYKIIFEPDAIVEHVREMIGGARKSEGRINWYFNFFSNETYFFLKHRPKKVLPIILITRWQWAFKCMFGFGREVSLMSIITPFLGIIDGVKRYRRYVNDCGG